jgi:membrane-associated protease RseP (regulator of RpoE activity)
MTQLPRWVPPPLFVLTALSVFVSSGLEAGNTPDEVRFNAANGLMTAAALMAILGAHEFGHWFVARRHGETPSLPLFIPMPFTLLGTLGAVILQRAPFKDRRTLIEVALAGPLLGALVALPLFVIGLLLSEIKPVPPPGTPGLIMMGDSIATRLIGLLRPVDTSQGVDIFLHPIGFAAWVGLLMTGVNLLPVGQLDGGHIAHALLGKRARPLSWAVIIGLLLMAYFASQVWLFWALMLALWGSSHPPLADEHTPLQRRHVLLALLALVMLVLLFVPQPISPF